MLTSEAVEVRPVASAVIDRMPARMLQEGKRQALLRRHTGAVQCCQNLSNTAGVLRTAQETVLHPGSRMRMAPVTAKNSIHASRLSCSSPAPQARLLWFCRQRHRCPTTATPAWQQGHSLCAPQCMVGTAFSAQSQAAELPRGLHTCIWADDGAYGTWLDLDFCTNSSHSRRLSVS